MKRKYRIVECEVNEDKIFIPQVLSDDGEWLNVDLCGSFTPVTMDEARKHLDRITRVPKPPIYHDYP